MFMLKSIQRASSVTAPSHADSAIPLLSRVRPWKAGSLQNAHGYAKIRLDIAKMQHMYQSFELVTDRYLRDTKLNFVYNHSIPEVVVFLAAYVIITVNS